MLKKIKNWFNRKRIELNIYLREQSEIRKYKRLDKLLFTLLEKYKNMMYTEDVEFFEILLGLRKGMVDRLKEKRPELFFKDDIERRRLFEANFKKKITNASWVIKERKIEDNVEESFEDKLKELTKSKKDK